MSSPHIADSEVPGKEPLVYDRLVRRHQSAAERESAGRQKGLADALTGSLLRGEARSTTTLRRLETGEQTDRKVRVEEGKALLDWSIECEDENRDGDTVNEGGLKGTKETDTDPKGRGIREWQRRIGERFVAGKDREFDYEAVDEDESFDGDWVDMEREERWFAEEEEAGADEGDQRDLQGETGIQDF